jgi:hypothetical protein
MATGGAAEGRAPRASAGGGAGKGGGRGGATGPAAGAAGTENDAWASGGAIGGGMPTGGAPRAATAAASGVPHTTQKRELGWFASPHCWHSRIDKQQTRTGALAGSQRPSASIAAFRKSLPLSGEPSPHARGSTYMSLEASGPRFRRQVPAHRWQAPYGRSSARGLGRPRANEKEPERREEPKARAHVGVRARAGWGARAPMKKSPNGAKSRRLEHTWAFGRARVGAPARQ